MSSSSRALEEIERPHVPARGTARGVLWPLGEHAAVVAQSSCHICSIRDKSPVRARPFSPAEELSCSISWLLHSLTRLLSIPGQSCVRVSKQDY